MSIPKGGKKINIIVVLVAIVVVLGFMIAFGGLKLWGFTSKRAEIKIVSAQVKENQSINVQPGEAQQYEFIASKTGKKYHLVECPGAKQISEKNRITFKSREEAEKAGYGPASNCSGLNLVEKSESI